MQKCQGYAWLHFQAAAFYGRIYLMIMLPATLLNVALGTTGLASVSELIGSTLWYLYLAIFVLNIIVGMLVALNGLLQPNVTAFEHRQLATDYVHLVRKMESELLMDYGRRVRCDDFRDMIDLEYENLMKNDMPVPGHIVRQFEEAVRDDMAKPEMILDNGLRRNLASVISGTGTPRYGPSNVAASFSYMRGPPSAAPSARSGVGGTPVPPLRTFGGYHDPPSAPAVNPAMQETSSQAQPPTPGSVPLTSVRSGGNVNWASSFVELQRRRRGSAVPASESSESIIRRRDECVSFADITDSDYAPMPPSPHDNVVPTPEGQV